MSKYLVSQLRHSCDLAIHMRCLTGWVPLDKILEVVPQQLVLQGYAFVWCLQFGAGAADIRITMASSTSTCELGACGLQLVLPGSAYDGFQHLYL